MRTLSRPPSSVPRLSVLRGYYSTSWDACPDSDLDSSYFGTSGGEVGGGVDEQRF